MTSLHGFQLNKSTIIRYNKCIYGEALATWMLLIGSALLWFVGVNFAVAVALFLVKIPVGPFHAAISFLLTIGFIYIQAKKTPDEPWLCFWVTLVVVTILIILSLTIAGSFYDLSWDGQEYHQKAIIDLVNGWNPLYSHMREDGSFFNITNNHYPKLPWINAASIYSLTGNIELGKMFNPLLAGAAFFCSLSLLLELGMRIRRALVYAGCAAMNPVVLYQLFSYYIDNQIASVLVCMFAIGISLIVRRTGLKLITLIVALVICFNIKFTALVYGVAIASVLAVVAWFAYGKKDLMIAVVVSLILGVGLLGFNPYLTNQRDHESFFYPILGKNAKSEEFFMQKQRPANLAAMDRFGRLYYSLFSESSGEAIHGNAVLKVPGVVHGRELLAFLRNNADVRIGGFGPLFSASLIIGGLMLLPGLVRREKEMSVVAALAVLLLGSALLTKEGWWARYAPQLWLLPVLVLAMFHSTALTTVRKYCSYAAVSLLILNLLLIVGPVLLFNWVGSQRVRAELATVVAKAQRKPVYVFLDGPYNDGGCRSNLARFERIGVHYLELPQEPELPAHSFESSRIKYYFAEEYEGWQKNKL